MTTWRPLRQWRGRVLAPPDWQPSPPSSQPCRAPSRVGLALEDVALAFGATLSNAASYTQLYAATLAVQDINEDSTLLPGYSMQLIAQRTFCSLCNRALLDWVTSWFGESQDSCDAASNTTRPVGYIGPSCSSECEAIAYIGGFYGIPQISYACTADFLTVGGKEEDCRATRFRTSGFADLR